MACVPCRPPFRVASANTPLTLLAQASPSCKRSTHGKAPAAQTQQAEEKQPRSRTVPAERATQKRAQEAEVATLTSGDPHPQHAFAPQYHHAALHTPPAQPPPS
jgi:hypothetical protein